MTAGSLTVWLVRHGLPDWDGRGPLGWSDPALSAAGEEQAAALGRLLAARPLVAVHASDLARARLTAAPVAAAHGLAVIVSADLRELHFGPWEGRALEELWREDPEAGRAWETDIRRTPPQFGESLADLEARAVRFAERELAAAAGEVAVVAHRGSLAALDAWLTGDAYEAAWARGLEPGEARAVAGRPNAPLQRS